MLFPQRAFTLIELCVALCSSLGNKSLIVFLNDHEDGIVQLRNDKLAVIPLAAHEGKLYWRLFPGYRDYMLFSTTKLTYTDNGSLWYCHRSATYPAWAIMINTSGRTRVAYPNKNGQIKDHQGLPLTCSLHPTR